MRGVQPPALGPRWLFPHAQGSTFLPEVATPASQPVLNHPLPSPAADFPPLGGYFPPALVAPDPSPGEGLEAFANFSCFP